MADESSVQPGRKRHRHPHVRRAFLASTASIAALIMLLGGIGFGSYYWAEHKIRVIGDASPSPGATGPPDFTGKCAKTSCNYLLLGSDSRAGLSPEEQQQFGTNQDIGGSNRSDTIMVVHLEPDQKQAVFLSFPRDLWVNIPGMGYGKINSAFEGGVEHGGAQRVARTIHEISGIRIDHILYVDLAGFEGVVDALGGVQMCVAYPMQDPLTGLDIPAGCQHFDGKTALAYVRTRHQVCDTIPDFARISRQQQFIRALLAKMLSPGQILQLPNLVPAVLNGLVVDPGLRNPAELVYLAGQLNGVNTGNADFRAVPTVPAGTYVTGQYLSIVKLVQPGADELFRRIRDNLSLGDLGLTQEQTAPSPAVIATLVVDRGSLGAAPPVFDTLTKAGFDTSVGLQDVSALGDVPIRGSVILFDPKADNGQVMAEVVHSYLTNLETFAAPKGLLPKGVDVAVIVGHGYEIPPPPSSGPTSTSECP